MPLHECIRRIVNKGTLSIILLLLNREFLASYVKEGTGVTKDLINSRANTLLDNVDDTQRQLDNEDRERLGRPKTVWIIHIPTRFPVSQSVTEDLSQRTTPNDFLIRYRRDERKSEDASCPEPPLCPCQAQSETTCSCPSSKDEWSFQTQDKWKENYEECGGRSQSPVDLPVDGLIRAKGARKLVFTNYDQIPDKLSFIQNEKGLTLCGIWKREKWPMVYGGAAHSRRYLFHSLSLYWPSEHGISGLHFPLETQVIHISAEYKTLEEAVSAKNDPQAILGIVNIFKFDSTTQIGIGKLINAACKSGEGSFSLPPMPLCDLNPPFREYVCYHGSLTIPPCTESVLWLVRRRSLPITREMASTLQNIKGPTVADSKPSVRFPQPLNDRKVYLFT